MERQEAIHLAKSIGRVPSDPLGKPSWQHLGVQTRDAPADRPEGVRALLLEALWIARASNRMYANDPLDRGLGIHDLQVLVMLRLVHPAQVATIEVARLLGISRPRVDKAFHRLASAGLISVEVQSHKRRRRTVTPAGRFAVDVNARALRRRAEITHPAHVRLLDATRRSRFLEFEARTEVLSWREIVELLTHLAHEQHQREWTGGDDDFSALLDP